MRPIRIVNFYGGGDVATAIIVGAGSFWATKNALTGSANWILPATIGDDGDYGQLPGLRSGTIDHSANSQRPFRRRLVIQLFGGGRLRVSRGLATDPHCLTAPTVGCAASEYTRAAGSANGRGPSARYAPSNTATSTPRLDRHRPTVRPGTPSRPANQGTPPNHSRPDRTSGENIAHQTKPARCIGTPEFQQGCEVSLAWLPTLGPSHSATRFSRALSTLAMGSPQYAECSRNVKWQMGTDDTDRERSGCVPAPHPQILSLILQLAEHVETATRNATRRIVTTGFHSVPSTLNAPLT